jgi:hypothetical protein
MTPVALVVRVVAEIQDHLVAKARAVPTPVPAPAIEGGP